MQVLSLPILVEVFFFPVLSLFFGVRTVQEQRRLETGNTDIFTPISEIMPIAE